MTASESVPEGASRAPVGAVHRFAVGESEVTVLSDGHLTLPTALLAPGAPEPERTATLQSAALATSTYEPAANLVLIRSGEDLVLFDTGGAGYQPDVGRIASSLALAGVAPSQITKVIFTHAHPDHIGGTVLPDGALRFPNAAYYVGETEWTFWTREDVWLKLPPEQHPFVVGARRTFAAAAGRLTLVRSGDDVHPGVRAIATPGHTPGHLSFEISGGAGLLIVGDAVTAPAVYFPHPDWTFGFDYDDDAAVKTRARLLDRAVHERTPMLGYHWPYPGLGRAEQVGGRRRFVPETGDDGPHDPNRRPER